jgi:hypothetical protein
VERLVQSHALALSALHDEGKKAEGAGVNAVIKTKLCRICKTEFLPRSSFQQTCNKPACAIEYSRTSSKERLAKDAKRAFHVERRVDRKGTRVALERLKNRRQLTKEAQIEFNRFIRERDRAQPCICCGSFTADSDLITGSRWDAGHYRSTGAAPHLRFNEDNCHRQRVVCNRNGSGRAVEYRRGLINRIGIARVEALENDNSIRKFSALELREVRDLYRRRRKEMEKAV